MTARLDAVDWRALSLSLRVSHLKDLPAASAPEFALSGRSNVGKSSLLNALAGRKGMGGRRVPAAVSSTPGRTRALYIYELCGVLRLVDLPGYGYAKLARRVASGFQGLARAYLCRRPNLRRVFFLLDARRGVGALDREWMAMLDEAAVAWQAVLTKADKVSVAAFETCRASVAVEVARHAAAGFAVLGTSARSGFGVAGLRSALLAGCGVDGEMTVAAAGGSVCGG